MANSNKYDIEVLMTTEEEEAVKTIANYHEESFDDTMRFVFNMGIAWCYDYFGEMGVGIIKQED